jgi:KDO2-lipid IV(A) lauroyltransferase
MIGYFFLRLIAEIFRLVPFRAMYVLSDGLAFLLHSIVGYRKKVVLENLRRSFPEKNEEEIRRIARLFYRNLTDTTLETVKYFTTSFAETSRRCPVLNAETVNQYLDRGHPVILAGSHYNNWEITGLTMPPTFHGTTVTAYKPLTNKVIDRYLNWTRSRTGMEMVSMEDTFKEMRKRAGEPIVWILLSDQSPSSRKSAHWVTFLGQDTASLPGMDVLARKFNYPVLYYHVRRVKRGFYEVEFSEIWKNPSEAAEMDITRAYARCLEEKIREQPENWLWSHKRWKIQRAESPA